MKKEEAMESASIVVIEDATLCAYTMRIYYTR
jgi:hypothetical protein